MLKVLFQPIEWFFIADVFSIAMHEHFTHRLLNELLRQPTLHAAIIDARIYILPCIYITLLGCKNIYYPAGQLLLMQAYILPRRAAFTDARIFTLQDSPHCR